MSAFGLIEMTRQRQGPSIKRNTYHDCPGCHGTGLVKMPDSVILDAMRAVQLAANHDNVALIRLTLAPDVAFRLLNAKRKVLNTIESETGKRVDVVGNAVFTADQIEIQCEDNRGREIVLETGRSPGTAQHLNMRPGANEPRR
jgi:ribonuclease E